MTRWLDNLGHGMSLLCPRLGSVSGGIWETTLGGGDEADCRELGRFCMYRIGVGHGHRELQGGSGFTSSLPALKVTEVDSQAPHGM